MNLSVGIVGLPNAGKSTLFNALRQAQGKLSGLATIGNYPFTTIEPNVGVVPVSDERLPVVAKLVGTEKIVPATVKFVDIAGLVKGAHKGEGLGNKFLAHIREVDLICHVLRAFSDTSVVHVAGEVSPERDKEIVETELIMADLHTLEKQDEAFVRQLTDQGKPTGKTTKEDLQRWEIIKRLKNELNKGKVARDIVTDEKEKELLKDLYLLTMKPVLYVINVSEQDLHNAPSHYINNPTLPPLNLRGGEEGLRGRTAVLSGDNYVIISAKIEAELAGFSEAEQTEYLKELGLEKSGLERLVQKAYERLGLISFYSGNEKETHAWTIRRGTKAVQAAGVIHTDFEKGFIKAEVISFEEFVSAGGWVKARELGKVRLEGKEYEIKDGDVIDFKVNV